VIRQVVLRVLDSTDPNSEDTIDEEDIDCLIDIFPSKTVLAKEYHSILCEQLFQLKNYEAEDQIRHVEILNGRFGETEMSNAKVMMKDLLDSRRVSALYSEKENHHQFFSSVIISNLFWPKLSQSTLNPPQVVKEY
jgi:hypothetical protein